MNRTIKCWIEAMRLRTLPVSVAGVITAIGYARLHDCFRWTPAILCLAFAVLAQIASNFANEYYDFKGGLDRPGREGPRRGVTEGDITPRAMLAATYLTLGCACAIGCSLLLFGSPWLILAGAFIAIGVIAYSAGPYPLSHHGLGEVAVLLFFGVIPVGLTYYLQSGTIDNTAVWLGGVSMGLMGANVLIVNNYRDADADRNVGKHTLAVIFGRRFAWWLYLVNGVAAVVLMMPAWKAIGGWSENVPEVYLTLHIMAWWHIRSRTGHKLTPLLGQTAILMLAYALAFTALA